MFNDLDCDFLFVKKMVLEKITDHNDNHFDNHNECLLLFDFTYHLDR